MFKLLNKLLIIGFLAVAFFVFAPNAMAAVNNFTADGGEWNTAGNWSLGHVPTNTEDCTFTGIVTPGVTLTITTTSAVAKSMDFSTAGATFTLTSTVYLSLYGNLTLKSGMTWSQSGAITRFYASGNLDTNGVTMTLARLRVEGCIVTLVNNNLNIGTGSLEISYSAGAAGFVTNNLTVTAGYFGDNGSAGAVTLTLGSSIINCTNVSFAAATLTVSDNTATINVTSAVDIGSNFGGVAWGTGGDTSFVYVMTGGKWLTLTGNNTVGNFTISWTTDTLGSSLRVIGNPTISGTFTVVGASTIARPYIWYDNEDVQKTITAAVVNITGAVDFFGIVGAGAGSWDLSGIASGNRGGNSGITFRTPATYYLDAGTANVSMTDNIWAISSGGGAGGLSVFPLPQDTIIIDNNSWDDTGNTLSVSGVVGAMDASALTEANTIGFASGFICVGDLLLSGAGVTVDAYSTITFSARLKYEASAILDIYIPTVVRYMNFSGYYQTSFGTYRLLNNLNVTTVPGTCVLNKGTLELNGKTLTCGTFSSSNANTRVLQDTAGGGKIVTTGLTGTVFNMATVTGLTVSNAPDIDIGTSNLTQTADVTFAGGGKTFGDFKVTKHAGNYDCIITGANTFGTFTLETPDATYQYSDVQFTADTTTTVDSFVAVGTASYGINIQSATAATHTLSDTLGTNTVSYCTITNSIAEGGAVWRSFLTDGNVDGGGNSGWYFTPACGDGTCNGDETCVSCPSDCGTCMAVLRPGVILKRNVIFGRPAWACGDSVTFTYRGSSVTYGTVNSTSSKCWLDRNLGASGVAASTTDSAAYGDLFQWGRKDDGHQVRSPAPGNEEGDMTLTTQPGHANFIKEQTSPYDWATTTWITRWTVADDDPCPTGWHVPTNTEWNTERLSWSSQNAAGAFASPLKLTLAGCRYYSDASLGGVGSYGDYWSSTAISNYAYSLSFGSGDAYVIDNLRATGFSVRCLKD